MTVNREGIRPNLAATVILAGAAAVRIPGLTRWAFEPDELSTWRDALHMAGPSANGPGALGRPVYYFLQHVLLGVFPGSPFSLRVPALLFGLLGVWLTWGAGRRLFGGTAGIVASLLVAFSPWHQYASGFARYWTLVYVLALLTVLWLIESLDSGRRARFRAACLVLTLGALTHPTFLFPILGVILALHLVTREGNWRWEWPSRGAWANLWIPFVALFGGWVLWLKVSGNGGALSNWNGRGLAATLTIFPGMVEWLTPAVVLAAGIGVLGLWYSRRSGDRRWAVVAGSGLASGVLLLFLAGRRTDVYADYGMAMLPLVYLTIGGAVERASAITVHPASWAPWAAGALLAAGAVPGVASNLRDGMRFDYRPAYDFARSHGPGRLVVGPSRELQRYYAPDLPFEELRNANAQLRAMLTVSDGFWLILANHRNGWVDGDDDAQAWVDGSCRVKLRSGNHRFDYREYNVQLAWCGGSPP